MQSGLLPPKLPIEPALMLNVSDIKHYRQSPGTHPGPIRVKPFTERVALLTGGRGWTREGSSLREVLPGDLIWNSPGDWTISKSDFDDPYQCLSITFTSPHRDGCGMPRFSHCADLEAINSFTREVLKRATEAAFDRQVLKTYLISRLVFWIHEDHYSKPRRDLPEPLQKTVDWLQQNYPRPCRLDVLGKVSGWSPAYLHKAFRQHLQTTPHQMVLQLRLKAVCDELITTLNPIKQIAAHCGFADSPTLSHAFKAKFGMTPKAYRDKHMHMKTE